MSSPLDAIASFGASQFGLDASVVRSRVRIEREQATDLVILSASIDLESRAWTDAPDAPRSTHGQGRRDGTS